MGSMQIVPLIHNSGNGGSRSIPICSMYCVYTNYIRLGQRLGTCFWVNYNISLTWIVQPFGDDSSKINHDSSEGEHWGRYNLPRCLYTFHTWSIGDIPYVNPSWFRSRFRIGWPWMISYPWRILTVLLYMVCHGSHQYTPVMLAYIPAPWILWVNN